MNNEQPDMNFDFITNQPQPNQKRGFPKKVIVLVILSIITIFALLLIYVSDNKQESQQSIAKTQAAQGYVNDFFSKIKVDDVPNAYLMMEETYRPPKELFEASAQFISQKVATDGCIVGNVEKLQNGQKIVFDCPLTDSDDSISIEFTLTQKEDSFQIVKYQLVSKDDQKQT